MRIDELVARTPMAPEPGDGPGAPAPETPAAPAAEAKAEPSDAKTEPSVEKKGAPETPAPETPAAAPGAEAETGPAKEEKTAKGDGELNLLDGGAEEGGGEPEAPTPEAVEAWKKGVKALDLGDGVQYDDALLDRLAPELMELTGGDGAKAERLVKAYTGHVLEEARRAQEAQEAFNAELVRQCRERWGADLGRVARRADAGGKAIFGEKLWNEIRSVRQFANNPDIMERLAVYGRAAASDRGVSSDRGGRPEKTATLSQQLGI